MANDVNNRGRPCRHMSAGQWQRAYNRMRHRKRMKVLFYIIAFLAVIVTAVILCFVFVFRIQSVVVDGKSRYPTGQIMSVSGVKKGQNLFSVDTSSAAKKVGSACPYLTEVSVNRRLPCKVVISVKEGTPSGSVQWNGKYIMMDHTGRVMEVLSSKPSSVPVVKGLEINSAQVGGSAVFKDSQKSGLYQQVAKAISDNSFANVTVIDVSDMYDLSVTCRTTTGKSLQIKLGNSTYLGKKFRFAKATMAQHLSGEAGVFNVSSVSKEKSITWFTPASVASSASAASSASSSSASSKSTSSKENSSSVSKSEGEDSSGSGE